MSTDYDPNSQTNDQWSSTPYSSPSPNLQTGGGPPSGQMNYALWADRVLAALIDGGFALLVMGALYVLLFLITVIGGNVLGAASQDAGGLFGCSGCCLFFVLPPISYFVAGLLNKVYWVSKRGYSIGQGVMKLKVVNASGNLIPMGTSILRLLATVGLGLIPFLGAALDLLWPLWDPQRQALHDKAVGTFVIKESR